MDHSGAPRIESGTTDLSVASAIVLKCRQNSLNAMFGPVTNDKLQSLGHRCGGAPRHPQGLPMSPIHV